MAEFYFPVVLIMVFVLFVLFSFSSLNVKIGREYLRIKFGYGIFWRKFELKKISFVKKVRNRWYYGWGIRYWPNMWIYNVSGFDAVEIVFKNGKRIRIGTDDAKNLERAILDVIKR